GELTSASQIQLGTRFRSEDITSAVDRIRELLQANGLYEAHVTQEAESMPSSRLSLGYAERALEAAPVSEQVFVTFFVKAGKRAKYEQPVIHGETKLSDGAILRATGWRIPLIHWWRHVTDTRTRTGIQGILGKYRKDHR